MKYKMTNSVTHIPGCVFKKSPKGIPCIKENQNQLVKNMTIPEYTVVTKKEIKTLFIGRFSHETNGETAKSYKYLLENKPYPSINEYPMF